MNETTLINALANAIHDDATLIAWCIDTYGHRHKVYKGIDARKPPSPESDYPAVNISMERKKEGYSLTAREHEVIISGGLYEENLKINASEYLIEYEFVENLIMFANYVKDAIVATDLGLLEISEYEVLYDSITFFPSIKFEMYFVFRERYYQGDNPFD